MSTRLRLLVALSALTLVVALAAPALAQSAEPSEGGASETGASEPAESEPAQPEQEGPAEEPDSDKIQLPLDLEDKQDLLGLALLGVLAAASAVALRGTVKQLRGDRPQADGTWRPR